MVNKNFKCILSVARTEYVKWITNPRIIIVGVLLIFMRTLAIEPLLKRAVKMGMSLSIFEPFVAIGNSGMLVMLMPCVFLILISDYPKMTGSTLFLIQRTGKGNWFAGQMIFLLMAIITFMCGVLAGSILVSNGEYLEAWSDVVTKYASRFPNEANSFVSSLLPSNLYNQIPLMTAVMQTLCLMSAYLLLLSMIIYGFKLIHVQSFGLFAAMLLVAAGIVTCSLGADIMWSFPVANTIVWLHYDEILGEPVVPIWHSFAYFGISIGILMILNFIAAKRYQFINIEQVD